MANYTAQVNSIHKKFADSLKKSKNKTKSKQSIQYS